MKEVLGARIGSEKLWLADTPRGSIKTRLPWVADAFIAEHRRYVVPQILERNTRHVLRELHQAGRSCRTSVRKMADFRAKTAILKS